MNIICYSKDRPCQLDLLLRSIEEYFDDDIFESSAMTVICKWSDREYFQGYEKVAKQHPFPLIVYEKDFQADVLGAIYPRMPLTMFLVDDNVFINKFDLRGREFDYLIKNSDAIAVSTRMRPGITYSYSNNIEMKVPEFTPEPLRWEWRGRSADWGYPMCTGDGNVYKTEDILQLLKSIEFNNPYEAEQRCAENPIDKPYMICFDEAKVLGVPNNLVQVWHKNRHGNVSLEWLNDQWLAGNRISLDNFRGIKTNSPHSEVEYKMEIGR